MQLLKEIGQLSFARRAGLLILSLYAFALFGYSVRAALQRSPDQRSFYQTSVLLLQKQNPYRTTIDYIKKETPNINWKGLDQAGGRSMYPPSTHILFIPFFAFLVSPQLGQISWCAWNIVFMGIIFYVIRKRYLPDASALTHCLLLLLIAGSASANGCLRYGQTSLFSFAFFMLTMLLKDRHKWLAGAAFALALGKPSLMLFFALYLLVQKEFRIVLTAGLIHLALTGFLAFWTGTPAPELVFQYLEKVKLQTGFKDALFIYHQVNGISLRSLFNLLDAPEAVKGAVALLLYSGTLVCLYKIRRLEESRALAIIGLLTLFVDYHWYYDFVVLFVLFPAFAKNGTAKRVAMWGFVYLFIFVYMPNPLRIGTFLKSNFPYLLAWQCLYILLYFLLFVFSVKATASVNLPKNRSGSSANL